MGFGSYVGKAGKVLVNEGVQTVKAGVGTALSGEGSFGEGAATYLTENGAEITGKTLGALVGTDQQPPPPKVPYAAPLASDASSSWLGVASRMMVALRHSWATVGPEGVLVRCGIAAQYALAAATAMASDAHAAAIGRDTRAARFKAALVALGDIAQQCSAYLAQLEGATPAQLELARSQEAAWWKAMGHPPGSIDPQWVTGVGGGELPVVGRAVPMRASQSFRAVGATWPGLPKLPDVWPALHGALQAVAGPAEAAAVAQLLASAPLGASYAREEAGAPGYDPTQTTSTTSAVGAPKSGGAGLLALALALYLALRRSR